MASTPDRLIYATPSNPVAHPLPTGFFIGPSLFMLTIKRTGSIRDLIANMQDVHGRVVPHAAAAALTRTAKLAQTETIPAEMQRVFMSPRPYTLKSLFVVPATPVDLSARVAVKNMASGKATLPEHYLLPEVMGGKRNLTRTESGLIKLGVMRADEHMVPYNATEAQYENGAYMRRLLRNVEASKGRKRSKGAPKGLFAHASRKGTRGIWQSTGKALSLMFLFTRRSPVYGQRLDYSRVVQRTAEQHFPAEFERAFAQMKRA